MNPIYGVRPLFVDYSPIGAGQILFDLQSAGMPVSKVAKRRPFFIGQLHEITIAGAGSGDGP